jgi:integrase
MAGNTVHRWWYRMCEAAGLVEHSQRQGLNMHRARHGFALEMRQATSLEAASQALGHSDLSTTMRHYGHWQPDELAAAFGPRMIPLGAPRKPAWLLASWKRRESNPRPRPHRAERLQA